MILKTVQVSGRGGCLKNWGAGNPLQIIYIEKLLQIKKTFDIFDLEHKYIF